MQLGKIKGWHVAFLTFAVLLLSAPASTFLGTALQLNTEWHWLWGRLFPISVMALAITAIHWFVPDALSGMLRPLRAESRVEVALVSLGKLCIPLAAAGGFALWIWLTEGGLALERRHAQAGYHENSPQQAFTAPGLVLFFVVGPLLGPIVEEIVFRGFLYRAWAERWGWFTSMILTSTLFALYHKSFVTSFLSSIVFVCVYRRTGTLLAPMIVHGIFNLALFYPFYGQFVYPRPEEAVADITTWWPQLACLAFVLVALPIYVFMSRHELEREPT